MVLICYLDVVYVFLFFEFSHYKTLLSNQKFFLYYFHKILIYLIMFLLLHMYNLLVSILVCLFLFLIYLFYYTPFFYVLQLFLVAIFLYKLFYMNPPFMVNTYTNFSIFICSKNLHAETIVIFLKQHCLDVQTYYFLLLQ